MVASGDRAGLNMHYVYILKSLKDQKLYIGLTNNIDRRLQQHNNGDVFATKGRRPLVLVRVEKFDSRSLAAKREKFLKSGVGRQEVKDLLRQ